MIAIFISQCHKNSLSKTRKILDSYADRIGSRVWKTLITQEGLKSIESTLKANASKNSSVSCWIVKEKNFKLQWIIGRKDFNEDGKIPISCCSL